MKELKKQNKNKVICPKCGEEANVIGLSYLLSIASGISFLLMCVFIWIPVIGWIVAPACLVVWILSLIASFIAKLTCGVNIKCEHCNSEYKLSKDEYKEYKQSKKAAIDK